MRLQGLGPFRDMALAFPEEEWRHVTPAQIDCFGEYVDSQACGVSPPGKTGSVPKVRNSVCVCVCVWLFRPVPTACGGSQARGPIGAAAAGLHHSHSNVGSEPRLRPAPQLMATLDP